MLVVNYVHNGLVCLSREAVRSFKENWLKSKHYVHARHGAYGLHYSLSNLISLGSPYICSWMREGEIVVTKKHDYIIAWIEIGGQRFEILVKPEYAFKYKEGEKVDLEDVLWTDTVYKDVRKGLKASPESLRRAFGTDDIKVIADKILKDGEIQLTSEQRRKLIEAKRRQIITYIARNAIDPKTGKPIPEARIETAMEELRIGVDPFKDAEAQAVEIVKKLARVMPIRLARALLEVVIPASYAGRVYRELQRLGEVKKMDWLTDGSLKAEIEIPAGAQMEFVNKIQKLTRGSAVVNVRKVA